MWESIKFHLALYWAIGTFVIQGIQSKENSEGAPVVAWAIIVAFWPIILALYLISKIDEAQ